MTSSAPNFEVQLYRKGRWEIESQYSDPAAAESAAKRLQSGSGRVEGVRVIKETYDPATNRFATTVLSRWLRDEEEQREAARQAKEAESRVESVLHRAREARLAVERERTARRFAWKPKVPFWFWPFVGAVAAALAGIFGLIGLHALLYPS